MLNTTLTVNSSRASVTLPGSLGTKDFVLVQGFQANKTIRRIVATATTTPQEVSIQHTYSGKGTYGQRIRTVVRADYKRLDTDVNLTGGITPSASAYLVIDRPVQSNGYITVANIKDLVGQVCDVVTVTGQLDSVLNLEG